ncbi:FtsX-like permease family protein [Shewanella sp. VB17]|uniref:ABC transporter permease n=1 Tax=Shewanella sp. VB17 TaxID=2739432 RepID=UPI001566D784|nr:FtsX-like permease family protein [Shewanella sp. VB17]NRD72895.1 FtsX-like permease family protein [Shewanella sp. VB17]
MNNFWLSLRIFIAHYRQAPLQAGAITVGVILAVTLLTGVRATNENALQSYHSATELLSLQAKWNITAPLGEKYLDESVYFKLRAAGFNRSLPVLQGTATSPDGKRWQIQGSDLVAALTSLASNNTSTDINANKSNTTPSTILSPQLPLGEMLSGAPIIMMSRTVAEQFGKQKKLSLAGVELSIIVLDDNRHLGSSILMDISLAQKLLNQVGKLSYIALFNDISSQQTQLNSLLGKHAQLIENDKGDSLTALTQSFHLNLTAMSLLAFIVGLFIAYNGVRYSLLKRQRLLSQLQQLGVKKTTLMSALLTEILILVIIGSVIGFIFGLQLSYWLQPMISVTLEQLYGAKILPGNWQWSWLFHAISLTLLAAFSACFSLLLQLIHQPLSGNISHLPQISSTAKMQKIQLMTAAILAVIASVLLPLSQDHRYSMALLALVLIAIPLALPSSLLMMINLLLKLLVKLKSEHRYRGLFYYQVAETKELIAPLSLAMMAMLLALTANISMNTLVGSFESTLRQWLDSRLHAELYIKPASEQVQAIDAFLRARSDVDAIYKQWSLRSEHQNLPINLVTRDEVSLKQTTVLKSALGDLWLGLMAGKLVMISEPLSIKLNISLGDKLILTAIPNKEFIVGGIFYSYGDPYGEIVISPVVWRSQGFPSDPISLAVGYSGSIDELKQSLQQHFLIPNAMIYSQTLIKQQAIIMFKKTFSITQVLNSLTLLVAAIGLFSACFMLTQARIAPMARLHTLGVTQAQLTQMVFTQMIIIVLFTCLIALPTGLILGYILIHKITLQAFGWSIAMQWDWLAYFKVVALALTSSLVAVALPLYQQVKKPLVSSLQREVI